MSAGRRGDAVQAGPSRLLLGRWATACGTALLSLALATPSWAETWIVEPNGDALGPFAPGAVPEAIEEPEAADPWLREPPRPPSTRDLRAALAAAANRPPAAGVAGDAPFRIVLRPGHHWLSPVPYADPSCGNCEDPHVAVPASLGALLSGDRVRLVGAEEGEAVLHTGSGYGILVEDCVECEISGLVITGGERDTSGLATDAAIVVRRSTVRIADNTIRDNIGDPEVVAKVVVGIAGIAGREDARMTIEGNRILRNSWDGIALYRGAEARVTDNEIDGVDLAVGGAVGGGRGVGIGLTWDARATVRGNRVARYWKGIGVFVDAQAVVEENVIEQIATWGLSLWDAGRGRPSARFVANVVDSTGACGCSIVRASSEPPAPGELRGNVFSRTGQNPKYDSGEPYCFQTAIALHAAPDDFVIRGNLLLENREPDGRRGSGDMEPEAAAPMLEELGARILVHSAAAGSVFFRRLGMETPGDWHWGRGAAR